MKTDIHTLVLKLQNQTGILAMLDEECLRPGTVTDDTFLEKLNQVCATHQHFESRMSKCSRFLNDTTLPHSCFRIQHYAGKVPVTWTLVFGEHWSCVKLWYSGKALEIIKLCYGHGGGLPESIVDQKVQTCFNLFSLEPKILVLAGGFQRSRCSSQNQRQGFFGWMSHGLWW